MLDRTISIGSFTVRLVYDEERKLYKGILKNVGNKIIYGDTANEVINIIEGMANNRDGD